MLFPFHCSVFCGMPIPYPKREFITDDENDDKSAKVGIDNENMESCAIFHLLQFAVVRTGLVKLS